MFINLHNFLQADYSSKECLLALTILYRQIIRSTFISLHNFYTRIFFRRICINLHISLQTDNSPKDYLLKLYMGINKSLGDNSPKIYLFPCILVLQTNQRIFISLHKSLLFFKRMFKSMLILLHCSFRLIDQHWYYLI